MSKGKQKPTQLLVLEGKRSEKGEKAEDILAKEPQFNGLKDLSPPEDIDEIAKKAWHDLAPIVQKVGLLTEGDRDAFGILCQIRSWIIQLHNELKDTSFGVEEYTVDPTGQEHLKVRVDSRRKELRQLYDLFKKYALDFGLVPRGRAGLQIRKEPERQGKPALNR